jgi:cystathionine beta-lyase
VKYDFDTVVNRVNTGAVKWDGMRERFGTNDLLPMWVADMDFPSPPEVVKALQERASHGIYGYAVRPDSFYEAVIAWMKSRHNFSIQREWISHSPGVVAGLSLIVRALTEPGDKIIVQPPVYYPFFHVIRATGRVVVENPLRFANGRYTMDFDDLEQKAASGAKMLILCSPHNPVGRVWTREELMRLGEICRAYNVLVVSDEVHGDLVYPQYTQTPFASISPEFANHSVTFVAPSKTFNLAGLQTALVIIPNEDLRKRYNKTVQDHFVGGANVFGVVAAEYAYRHGGPWLDALLEYLQGNLEFLMDYIHTHIPSIKVVRPEGTYLVWLDFRELGLGKKELDDFVVQRAKVALDRGHMFGTGGEGFQRMNIACPRALLEQGLKQIADAVDTFRLSTPR